MRVKAFAPGRVNLIGDHTDYSGGLVLPMALEMGTTVTGVRGGDSGVRLESGVGATDFDRYVSAVASLVSGSAGLGGLGGLGGSVGLVGRVTSDLPIGAGLSSSASLEVAVALALGCPLRGVELARLCQAAEHAATGVPCGIMDQLASVAGVAGCALLIDCSDLSIPPVPVPVPPADEVEIVVVHSGQARRLAGSEYADRRAQCEAASAIVGPLRSASPAAVEMLEDPVLRARARHVVSENARVRLFASALAGGDLVGCGDLMLQSHRSLAGDFEVSTPALDELVAWLVATPGVFGARLTGAGFGGCVVALARPGAVDIDALGGRGWGGPGQSQVGRGPGPPRGPGWGPAWGPGWRVRPGGGAFVVEL